MLNGTPMTLETSQIFYNVTVGVAAVVTATAGSGVLYTWARSINRAVKINNYKLRYPQTLYDNPKGGWTLTRDPSNRIAIYLLDHKKETRHWIANWDTFCDVFGNIVVETHSGKDTVFKIYKDGSVILTTGKEEPFRNKL